MNIDFDDIDDPSSIARDASDFAYIANASEAGDVLFSISRLDQIPMAIHVVKQAYDRITE